MPLLVRVAKTQEVEVVFRNANIRVRHPMAIAPDPLANGPYGDGRDYTQCEFFEIEEQDLDGFVSELTRQHPGKEVRVYTLSQVSERPAGDMVTKKVTKDGVLPA
jgi:hypothetical protein